MLSDKFSITSDNPTSSKEISVRFASGAKGAVLAFLSLITTSGRACSGFFCLFERSIVINLAETTEGLNVSASALGEGPQKSERKIKTSACNDIANRVGKK